MALLSANAPQVINKITPVVEEAVAENSGEVEKDHSAGSASSEQEAPVAKKKRVSKKAKVATE